MKLLNKIYSLIIIVGFFYHYALAEKLPFSVGERLEYSAKFNFIPAGKAFLTVVSIDTINSLPAYHVRYEAQTGPIADKIRFIKLETILIRG